MGHSHQRDIYLQKIRMSTGSAGEFVTALEKSPYRTHRRVAIGLRAQLNEMSAEAMKQLTKQEDSEAFKKTLGL